MTAAITASFFACLIAGLSAQSTGTAKPSEQNLKRVEPTKEELKRIDDQIWGRTPEVQALIAGHDPNARDKVEGKTALAWAVRAGNHAAFKRLLALKPDVNAVDRSGRTALHEAAPGPWDRDTEAFVEDLLDAGADPNVRDPQQTTPLMTVAGSAKTIIAALLLRKMSPQDVDARDVYGNTALLFAAGMGNDDMVQRLLAKGAEANVTNKSGRTPLIAAVQSTNPDARRVVEMLLEARADVNVRDKDGLTPLQHAEKTGKTAIADLLRKAGAK